MSQDIFTKEFFEKLGWEYREDKWKGAVAAVYFRNDNHARIDYGQADKIAKEVQRMVIEARIEQSRRCRELIEANANGEFDEYYGDIVEMDIDDLQQQLKDLGGSDE